MIGGLAALALAVGGALAWRGLRTIGDVVRAQAEAHAAARASAEAEEMPAAPVRLYTTSWCPHCKRAKQWLSAQQVDFVEVDVERNPAAAREHRKVSPRGTIPVLDANGEVVVGFSGDAYRQALDRGRRRK